MAHPFKIETPEQQQQWDNAWKVLSSMGVTEENMLERALALRSELVETNIAYGRGPNFIVERWLNPFILTMEAWEEEQRAKQAAL